MSHTILVTGGAGFVGTNLIIRLLKEGHVVYSLDNYSTGYKNNEQDGCHYINGDICEIDKYFTKNNTNETNDLPKLTHIFHLAALARIQPSFKHPTEVFETNVRGTQMVLEFARKNGIKVIYSGSSSRWHNPENSPYAMSKYLGEQLCKLYKISFQMPIQIARFYNVYGRHEITDGEYATVIGIWRKQLYNGEPLTIIGDGEQRRDVTHIDDIVDGLYIIMQTEIYHEDAWELGTGKNYSINEIFEMFRERYDAKRCNIADKPHNYRETIRYNDDSVTVLGWDPKDQLLSYIQTCQDGIDKKKQLTTK